MICHYYETLAAARSSFLADILGQGSIDTT